MPGTGLSSGDVTVNGTGQVSALVEASTHTKKTIAHIMPGGQGPVGIRGLEQKSLRVRESVHEVCEPSETRLGLSGLSPLPVSPAPFLPISCSTLPTPAALEIVHRAVPYLPSHIVPAASLCSSQNPLPRKTLPDPPRPSQAGVAERPLDLQGPLCCDLSTAVFSLARLLPGSYWSHLCCLCHLTCRLLQMNAGWMNVYLCPSGKG